MFDLSYSKELVFTGNIIQDSDNSIDPDESERRFNRYIELLDSIEGKEGVEVAKLVIRSMRAKDDYGAYQTSQRALFRFPPEVSAQAIVDELPDLIDKNTEWAGEILCGLANEIENDETPYISAFSVAISRANQSVIEKIMEYIKNEEIDGWLSHRVGVLNITSSIQAPAS